MSFLALSLILVAAVLHALWNFTTKTASGNLNVVFLGLWLASLVCFPVVLIFFWSDIDLASSYPFILATGIIHAFYFFGLSKAYEYGDISTVYPVARGIGVAGTAVLARVLLQEDISLPGFLGITLICLGIVLIGLKTSQEQHHYKSLFIAAFVGLTIGGYSIVDKQAVQLINPIAYIFGQFFLAAVFLTPYILIRSRADLLPAWRHYKKYIFIIGLGSMGTYLIILFTFQIAHVSYVVAVRESSVVVGALLGFKFLHEKYTLKKLAGISIIVLALVIIKMA
ncbi:MAG: EamA family transporter [Deltaproteobacteria bacterium]|nr:EamA family transporter [Deltaproteobacteria bacterium]MBW2087290.1 EamA family transporter [Deltaproteobacteria bacterium]